MNFNEYQELSKRTMPEPIVIGSVKHYGPMAKSNYAMGLAGESGEVIDLIKKEVHHGHIIHTDKVKGELGDALHYLSGLATMYGFTLEEVAATNIEKLKKRYPEGFNTKDSVKRVDVND